MSREGPRYSKTSPGERAKPGAGSLSLMTCFNYCEVISSPCQHQYHHEENMILLPLGTKAIRGSVLSGLYSTEGKHGVTVITCPVTALSQGSAEARLQWPMSRDRGELHSQGKAVC